MGKKESPKEIQDSLQSINRGWEIPPTSSGGGGEGDMLKATYDASGVAEQLVGLTAEQTLSNKTFETLDYRSSATETASRTIYLATTGSDTTGDGSVGSPFFSLHRAFKDIKPLVASTITIKANDGTYSMSSLGDLNAHFSCVGNGVVKITTNNASIDDNYQSLGTPVTGTFTSNDGNRPIHADTGKSWTPDAYLGDTIHVTGVLSGSALTGANKYIPIVQNTATQLISAMWGFDNHDYGTYEIVEHAVKFDLGSNDFLFSNASYGKIELEYIEISCGTTALYNVGLYDFVAEKRLNILNCKIVSGIEIPAKVTRSFVQVNGSSTFRDCSQVAFYTETAVAPVSMSAPLNDGPIIYHCTFRTTDGTNAREAVFMAGAYAEVFDAYLINFKSMFEIIKGGTVSLSGKIGHAGLMPFLVQTFDRGSIIKDNYAELYGGFYALNVVDEPTTGRLTYDGSTAATEYFNLEKNFNALDIAPDNKNGVSFYPIQDADADTGANVIDSFVDDLASACRWDYVINNGSGTNMRSGSIIACWDGVSASTPVYNEYGTTDIGDTSGVTFSVDKSTNTVRLVATTTSDNWDVKVQRYLV